MMVYSIDHKTTPRDVCFVKLFNGACDFMGCTINYASHNQITLLLASMVWI